jgi:hypothetical protein
MSILDFDAPYSTISASYLSVVYFDWELWAVETNADDSSLKTYTHSIHQSADQMFAAVPCAVVPRKMIVWCSREEETPITVEVGPWRIVLVLNLYFTLLWIEVEGVVKWNHIRINGRQEVRIMDNRPGCWRPSGCSRTRRRWNGRFGGFGRRSCRRGWGWYRRTCCRGRNRCRSGHWGQGLNARLRWR